MKRWHLRTFAAIACATLGVSLWFVFRTMTPHRKPASPQDVDLPGRAETADAQPREPAAPLRVQPHSAEMLALADQSGAPGSEAVAVEQARVLQQALELRRAQGLAPVDSAQGALPDVRYVPLIRRTKSETSSTPASQPAPGTQRTPPKLVAEEPVLVGQRTERARQYAAMKQTFADVTSRLASEPADSPARAKLAALLTEVGDRLTQVERLPAEQRPSPSEVTRAAGELQAAQLQARHATVAPHGGGP